jgi:serine protease Do
MANRSLRRHTLFGLLAVLSATAARAAEPAAPAAAPDAAALERQFRTVVERVAPAVVAISASTEADDAPASCRTAELNSDKLQQFLARTTRVVGTGLVYAADGYILTNDHVVDGAEQLWVTMDDRKVYPAMIVGSDPRADLAVLKIPARNLPTVRLGDGGRAARGQWSIAVGNPYGLSGDGGMCVSVGIISAVHRSLPRLSEREDRLYCDLLQTTAQINPGNSGGPLFDLAGDVIGINTAVVLPQHGATGDLNGIGFAVPVDAPLRAVVAHLQRGDELPYGYLGVIVSNPTDQDRRASGLNDAAGVCVDQVRPDSPAVDALRTGDVILALDGRPVSDSGAFVRLVGSTPPDRAVAVSLLRDGHPVAASVTLRRRRLPVPAVTRATQRLRWGGMLVVPMPAGGGPGVKVEHVDPASPFARAGVRDGQTLRTVAGRPVRSIVELQDVINDVPLDQCALGVVDPDADATASIRN